MYGLETILVYQRLPIFWLLEKHLLVIPTVSKCGRGPELCSQMQMYDIKAASGIGGPCSVRASGRLEQVLVFLNKTESFHL